MLEKIFLPGSIEVGCDEAGRGALSGPVVAAAVILPDDFTNIKLNDSKKLTEKDRNLLRGIIEKEAIAWAIGIVDNNEIDRINILNASIKAMHLALDQLMGFNHIIVDGNRFKPYRGINYNTIIKGDGKYNSIAAASILAKTHRDEIMLNLANIYPEYLWDKNKGYPTKTHRIAIKREGITPLHRKSFCHAEELLLDLDFS